MVQVFLPCAGNGLARDVTNLEFSHLEGKTCTKAVKKWHLRPYLFDLMLLGPDRPCFSLVKHINDSVSFSDSAGPISSGNETVLVVELE